jgi:DNA mismatch repair ATPase MutL
MFKSYVRSVAKRKGIDSSLSDPFLCIHLQCPLGSYDANIEPAKDDVLFTDPKTVLSLAAGLFKQVYGNLNYAPNKVGETTADGISDNHAVSLQQSRDKESNVSSGFETGRVIREMTPTSPQVAVASFRTSEPSRITHSQLSDSERVIEDEATVSPINSRTVNPWVIAKMNVSLRADNCNINQTATNQLTTPAREPRPCQTYLPS